MRIGPPEISARVNALHHELLTSVYFSEEKGKIIFARVIEVVDGLYREQDTPVVLPFDTSPEDIAHQAKKALLDYKQGGKTWSRADKIEWPAFQASKLKSQKEFSSFYVRMDLKTINTTFRIVTHETAIEGIFVGAELSQGVDDLEFGETLFRVYRCCQQMAKVDFVV